MKSKKKLLIAMAAMSVAAIGAGTVSTFAWYQATTIVTAINKAADSGTIQATKPEYAASAVNLPIDVEIVRLGAGGTSTSSADLELGHYYAAGALDGKKAPNGTTYASSPEGFYHAYFKSGDNNSIVYTTAAHGSPYETHASFQINVKMHNFASETSASTSKPAIGTPAYWKDTSEVDDAQYKYVDENGNVWTQDTATAAVDEMTATWAVARNGNSRAMFYGASVDTAVSAIPTAAGATGIAAGTITKSLDGITKSNAITVGYFGEYVDGEGAENNRDSGTIGANFTVTVSKSA